MAQATRFIGRERELAVLERSYQGAGSTFVPIYGRRRVGKTELILRFLQDKPAIYYVGQETPGPPQVREFLRVAAEALRQPLLGSTAIETWQEAIEAVEAHRPADTRFVLVFDEFQWSAQASPELPSVLQKMWDLHWSRQGKVMLILCGSYLGFMEREVLGRKSPLFGRRTAQIKLPPFSYREAAEFHPKLSRMDQARVWFLCGGIPFYLRLFDPGGSLSQNIQRNFIDEYAPLSQEPHFLLREELRDVEKYQSILSALAAGKHRLKEIESHSTVAHSSLTYYLQQLIELGYAAKELPLTTRPGRASLVRYVLKDPVLRFWFRFILPNSSKIARLSASHAYQQLIRPGLDAYFGVCFELLARDSVAHIYQREGIDCAFEVGEYWDRETQIDVVSIRDDGWIDLGECKWGKVKSWPGLRTELSAKVAAYPNPENRTIRSMVFTRSAPPKGVEGLHCVSLESLYA